MADVFISYARDDAAKARQLQRALVEVGLSVFEDQDVLVAGTDFSRAIADSLRSAKAVVVLLSANTRRGEWVQEELTSVLEAKAGPLVIPVLLDRQAKENWVWPLVANRQAIDLTNRPDEIAEVATRVRKAILRTAQEVLPPPARSPESAFIPLPSPSRVASTSSRGSRSIFIVLAILVAFAALAFVFLAPVGQGSGATNWPTSWLVLGAGAAGVLVGYLLRKWRE